METNLKYYWEIVNSQVAIEKFNNGKEKLFILYDDENEKDVFIESENDLWEAVLAVEIGIAEIGIFKLI